MKRRIVNGIIISGITSLMLATGCSKQLSTLLGGAACDGNIEKVRNLLKLGAKVNATDGRGYSALIDVEACKGHDEPTRVQLIELLIANGAAVNLRSRDGTTSLMYAARNGDTEVVNALLRNGAAVNIGDNDGETPLMKAAASSCSEETVRALLTAGADLNARDHKGRNPLDSFHSSYACPQSKVGDMLQIAGTQKGR